MVVDRYMTGRLKAALSDTPVVFISGPRQAGKSTLAHELKKSCGFHYFTFDESSTLSFAQRNPEQWLEGLQYPVAIDEAQRAPDIFLAIKLLVDQDRTPGKFLLTGSANVMMLPKIADSLAGRMEIIPLMPYSYSEIIQSKGNFVDALYSDLPFKNINKPINAWDIITMGGYPEIQMRKSSERRHAWFESYIQSILYRDIRELANIEKIYELPNLLNLAGTRVGCLLNYSELSRSSKIPQTTLKRYMSILETMFLISTIQPWSKNASKRYIKSPKIMFTDTGLLSYLLGVDTSSIANSQFAGATFENYIFTELFKQSSWSKARAKIFHYRTHNDIEVDFVLEQFDKRIVGIEAKATTHVKASYFKGLQQLAEDVGENFHRGVIIYRGDKVLSFGKKLWALPFSTLFEQADSN